MMPDYKIVGIWGAYRDGNFGDDLMALYFAKLVEEHGRFSPLVYGIDEDLAAAHLISQTSSAKDLVSRSSLVLLGGGGHFVQGTRGKRMLQAILRRNLNLGTRTELEELVAHLQTYPRQVIALSLGGAGTPGASLQRSDACLWRSLAPSIMTVRLPSDRELVSELGHEAHYYPDVVLDVPSVLPTPPAARLTNTIRIGLNLKRHSSRLLLPFLRRRSRSLKAAGFNIDLVSFESHLRAHRPGYEFSIGTHDPDIESLQYESPTQLLSQLQSLDLVISSKLHVGVAALGVGTPFASYAGPPKAKAFLHDLDLPQWHFPLYQPHRVASLIEDLAHGRLAVETDQLWSRVRRAAILSQGHRKILDDTLDALARNL